MSEKPRSKAVTYRRKAQELIRQSQKDASEPSKRYLLELASAWLELAWLAEEEQPNR